MLRVKALVGNRGASVFHVFEMEQKLPKFAMYVPTNDARVVAQPKSSVVFQVRRQPSLARRGVGRPREGLTQVGPCTTARV